MPGRPNTRTATSKSARTSTEDVEVPEEQPDSTLRRSICTLFYEAQKTTAGHRKLVVSLRKTQEICCYEPPSKSGKKDGSDFDEDDFNTEVTRCLLRVLPVRKSEGAADRVIHFMTSFLRFANEKDAELVPECSEEDDAGVLETPTTRLTTAIFGMVLPLLLAKDKAVRYRATQITRHVVSSLQSIDDETYHLLRAGLLKRIRDKEAMVRVQAVLGLAHLLGNEEGNDLTGNDEEEDSGLLAKLLDVLQNDPSADVRKSLLLNLPLTPNTLPYLLERARDVDPATRRALYSKLLPALGDFRHLSLAMREKLLRWGLRDRDDNVQKATARLFRERWIEDIASAGIPEDQLKPGQPAPASIDALLELMERIDIVNSGVEDGIALPALKEFWEGRPDYVDAVSFQDPFWDKLTAESVFMVRSFNDFCRSNETRYGDLLEEKMPEVTKLAFMLERYSNKLTEKLREPDHADEDIIEPEFIVEQIMHIAETLDYSDEIGRRKMFALLREMVATPELPEEITKLAVGVLRGVCGGDAKGERDFCGVVLEAIAEVHDTIADPDDLQSLGADDSFHSARSAVSSDFTPTGPTLKPMITESGEQQDAEKAVKEIMVNMKCLHIAQCMLQNVGGNLQSNAHLVTMLNNLVVPAVRSHEAPIRERGLQCLGLCCLLDKQLAEENLTLFIHCFTKGHPALQVHALETICDILSVHPSLVAPLSPSTPAPGATATSTEDSTESPHLKSLLKAFSRAIRSTADPKVIATAVTSLAKLYLTSVLSDEGLLTQLALTFFDSSTADNHAVRQALSYFLPAFAHSRRANMETMGRVACDIIKGIVSMHDEFEEEEKNKSSNELVGITAAANMLADWTDVRRLVIYQQEAQEQQLTTENEQLPDCDVHLDLAAEALERALGKSCEKEYRKALVSLVAKLNLTSEAPRTDETKDKMAMVKELVAEALAELKLETAGKNGLVKLQASLDKALTTSDGGDNTKKVRKSLAPNKVKEKVKAKEDEGDVKPSIEDDDNGEVTIKGDDEDEDRLIAGTADESLVEELLDGDDTVMRDV